MGKLGETRSRPRACKGWDGEEVLLCEKIPSGEQSHPTLLRVSRRGLNGMSPEISPGPHPGEKQGDWRMAP